MVWVIAEFTTDRTVSACAKKWETKIGKKKKMYFPKKNVAAKIKAAVDVDKKSGKWDLHCYRLLMNGATFETYESAREAEAIAQSHSTMKSFEETRKKKAKARKRPKVNFDSSSDGGNSQDFENIKKLSTIDAGMCVDKNYIYENPRSDDDSIKKGDDLTLAYENPLSDDEHEPVKSSDDCTVADAEYDETVSSKQSDSERLSNLNGNESEGESGGYESNDDELDDENESKDANSDDDSSRSSRRSDNEEYISDNYGNESYEENEVNESSNDELPNEEENRSFDGADPIVKSLSIDNNKNGSKRISQKVNQSNFRNVNNFPFESTNLEQGDFNAEYQSFSGDRRLFFIEKTIHEINQRMEEQRASLKEAKDIATETCDSLSAITSAIQGLQQIIKELTAEVFNNKEELKKRNGLFTDVLVPTVRIPIKNRKRYEKVALELQKHKVVDNMIKFLASTINETTENSYIKTCLDLLFTKKFFMTKVWWKTEPNKINIKHSQILHCIRGKFKS